jgi:hypothetical protein
MNSRISNRSGAMPIEVGLNTIALALLAASITVPHARGQERPYGAGWHGWLDIDQRTCIDRAQRALAAIPMPLVESTAWYVHGATDPMAVNIACVADDETPNLVSAQARRVLVSVDVIGPRASLSRAAALRDAAGDFMRRGSGAAPPPMPGTGTATPPAPATPPAATGGPAVSGGLVGMWRGCEGRTLTFTPEGNEIVGRWTVVEPRLSQVFRPGEVWYRVRQTAPGTYTGQVLWKFADGRSEWRPTTITIAGGQLRDTGSDACSNNMTAVAGAPPASIGSAGAAVGAPPAGGNLIGAWRGCEGRVFVFTPEDNNIVGRWTVVEPRLAQVFRPGEIAYRVRQTGPGTYTGQVLWKLADGRSEWRPTTITIAGGQFRDTGSDACSNSMTAVAGG